MLKHWQKIGALLLLCSVQLWLNHHLATEHAAHAHEHGPTRVLAAFLNAPDADSGSHHHHDDHEADHHHDAPHRHDHSPDHHDHDQESDPSHSCSCHGEQHPHHAQDHETSPIIFKRGQDAVLNVAALPAEQILYVGRQEEPLLFGPETGFPLVVAPIDRPLQPRAPPMVFAV